MLIFIIIASVIVAVLLGVALGEYLCRCARGKLKGSGWLTRARRFCAMRVTGSIRSLNIGYAVRELIPVKRTEESLRLRKNNDRRSQLDREAASQARTQGFLEKIARTRYVVQKEPVDESDYGATAQEETATVKSEDPSRE